MKQLQILLFCCLCYPNFAQQEFAYEDEVYLDHIKSVKFHHQGLYTSLPIIDLGSRGYLEMSFDDILGGDRDYVYSLIHCDKDWNPSNIDEMEYTNGFNNERIENWDYSIGTKLDYTHYTLRLPNEDLSWQLSGNYLLVVKDNDSNEWALTRRFMIVEPRVKIQAEVNNPIRASQVRTHHEIDFIINHKDYTISNPQREIYVSIVQNGNWQTAVTNLQPRVVTGYNLNFINTEQVTFPALKEYRGVDLRSVRSKGFGVLEIDIYSDTYEVIVGLDRSRSNQRNFDVDDLNGQFLIETLDDNSDALKSEYLDVLFSLNVRDEYLGKSVCVTGSFSDWKCRSENTMVYDFKNQLYNTFVLLKQGYYDYQYVLVENEQLNYQFFEGNDFSTRNEYAIFVYQRGFADRYDRLIGVSTFSSGL